MWKVFCDSDYVSFNIETDDAEDTESIKDEIIDEVHEILDDWIGDFSGNDDVFSPYTCEKMIDEYTHDRLTSTFTTVFYTCEEWSDDVLQCTR